MTIADCFLITACVVFVVGLIGYFYSAHTRWGAWGYPETDYSRGALATLLLAAALFVVWSLTQAASRVATWMGWW